MNNARKLLSKFDECIKRRTTLSPHQIRSWEQSDIKGAFKKDVIRFFENLKETFKLFEKGFIAEVKEMNDIFEQMKDEVDQCSVAKKCFEIEKKQLLLNNDRFLEENIASDIMCTYLRSLNEVDNCEKYKSIDIISKNNKLRAQLKEKFSESQMNQNGTSVNTKLSKPSTLGTKLYSVTPIPKSKVISKVVKKNDLSKSVTSHLTTNKIIEKCTKVLAPCLLKIETKPINVYFMNNRVVHRDYLKVTKEHVAKLQELLEDAISLKPLDEHIGHASKFAERIQELLVYVSASCPFTQSKNEKWAPATSFRKSNKPYVDASKTKQAIETNTQEHAVKQNTRKTNNTMLHSTGRVSSTNASGSKPKSNTKNDRIPQLSSRSKKNKVEAHHRKFKSSANKNNHVSDCNVNVKNVSLPNNSDTICLSCNECLKTVPPSSSHDTSTIVVPPGHILTTTIVKKLFLAIKGYGDLKMGNILILRIYYIEGLGHNLFSVVQFFDSDLKVAFRKHTCFVRNLEGVDLLSGSRGSNIQSQWRI
ncbi:hypothetical protein Tco_1059916 [Tanacetum coccineum]